MIDLFVPRVGGILSADIAVPQHEREVRFYARVLSTGENPLWREDLMNNRGTPIIGLGACSTEYADLPLQWMPHIQVADVALSVERTLGLGGSEVMHGRGDDGTSQWAVLLDPNGAAFGIIPVISEDQIPPDEGSVSDDGEASIGCISWLDLTVTNASATRDFYQTVVGWSVQEVEVQDTSERYDDYKMLGDDGNPAAGIRHARGANLDLPPVWMLHLPVGDLAESLRQVREGGGKIIKEAMGGDGGYAYAVIQDPVGVSLALVQG
jgi:predicted enzyme related to lactoylglutathione lyase